MEGYIKMEEITDSVSSRKENLADFIIAGAMKSASSSLHHILNKHERIYMPDREIFFFDFDDIQQHPDHFVHFPKGWTMPDYRGDFDANFSWYKSLFENAGKSQLIGDYSPTYMASQKAPARIADLLPEVKIIFMLRDPVERTYSHYWHLLRSTRAIYDFEKSIQYNPETLLQRSFYKNHVARYLSYFPRSNMKFVVFEEFIQNTKEVVDDVTKFLGLETTIDLTTIETHKGPSKYPRSLRTQIIYNRIFRRLGTTRRLKYFPKIPDTCSVNMPSVGLDKFFRLILKFASRCLNASRSAKIKSLLDRNEKPFHLSDIADLLIKNMCYSEKRSRPPMNPETRMFLENLFAKENKGLSQIIDIDLKEYWPYMDNKP